MSQTVYDLNQEPIVISKATLDILLKQENPADLIALYTFYYYTAKWQQTNQPKSTTNYTATGLGWSEKRVRERKQQLKELGLIKDVKVRGEGNRVTGHYIQVVFIWNRETFEQQFHPGSFPQGGNNHTVEKLGTNALSANRGNALSAVSKSKDTKVSYGSYLNHPKSVQEVIKYWNSLPKARKHKRSDTKVYRSAAKMIDNLLSSQPLVCTKNGKPTKPLENFIDHFGINDELLDKQWTVEEINGVIHRLHDEELKEDESRDLPSVLWNNFAKRNQAFSLFLYKADQKQVPETYYKLANRLASIVDPGVDTPRLAMWAKDFEQFIGSNGTTSKDVSKLLNWYERHIDDRFVPKSDDAREFCSKFKKIWRAMERDKSPNDSRRQEEMKYASRPEFKPSDYD